MRIYDSSGRAVDVSHVYYPPALLHGKDRAFWGEIQKCKGDKIVILHGENGNIQRFKKISECVIGFDYDDTLHEAAAFRAEQFIPLDGSGWKGCEIKAFLQEKGVLQKIERKKIKNIVCKITFDKKYKMKLKKKNKMKIPKDSELRSFLPKSTPRKKAISVRYGDSINTAHVCGQNGRLLFRIAGINAPFSRLGRITAGLLERSPETDLQEVEIHSNDDKKMKRFYGGMITPTADCASSLFKNGCSLYVVTARMGNSPFNEGNEKNEKERLRDVKNEIFKFGMKNGIGFFHVTNAFSRNMFCLYDDMALSADAILQENQGKQFGVSEQYFFNDPSFGDFYKENIERGKNNLVVLAEKEREEDVRKRLEAWARRHACDAPSLKTGKDIEMHDFCIPQAIRVQPGTGFIIPEVGGVLGKRSRKYLERSAKKLKTERSR